MKTPIHLAGPVIPYVTPDGHSLGRLRALSGETSFQDVLSNTMARGGGGIHADAGSPLVKLKDASGRLQGSGSSRSLGRTASLSWSSSGYVFPTRQWGDSPLRLPTAPDGSFAVWRPRPYIPGRPGPVQPTNPGNGAPGSRGSYFLEKVGMIDRAPMAMFEHNGELIVSAITRNGIDETPVWSYSDGEGVQKRSVLPELAESGHYGYSFGDGLHITLESASGPVDYTAPGPGGPWTKHDYTNLAPHAYKNLHWGFSYKCPVTGREFMGFGDEDHPGMVITLKNGKWELLSSPEDMRFPTGLAVVNRGANRGTTLVSSSWGDTRLHAVGPDGETRLVKKFPGWGVLRADHRAQAAYVATDQGRVYWASFDDLDNWKECKYKDPEGYIGKLQGFGEPNIHPRTGRMIFPAAGGDSTKLYEARRQGGDIVLQQVADLKGVGEWGVKTAAVGNDFYVGAGLRTNLADDRTPGVLYKLRLR